MKVLQMVVQMLLFFLLLTVDQVSSSQSDEATATLPSEEMCNPRQFQDFRGTNGTVTSPGYPEPYRYYRKQCTLIGVEGQESELVFNVFHIAFAEEVCRFDFLEIYTPDGRRLYGPLCGNLFPEPIQFSGEVMVYFESDGYERKPGFSAEYGPVGTVENPHACTEIQDGSGFITSPDFNTGGRYPNNYYECWLLGNAEMRVDIVFRRLLLQDDYPEVCEYDALVFSSLSDDGQYHQEARLCGSDLPDDLYFRHGPIKVEFTTDQDFALKRFNFHYNLNSIACTDIQEGSGFITSPDFNTGGRYPNNYYECWVLGNADVSIDIEIKRFILEYEQTCQFDALIFSSLSDDGQYHQEVSLCGTNQPEDLHYPQGPIKVEFITDDSVVMKGFNFQYNLNDIDRAQATP